MIVYTNRGQVGELSLSLKPPKWLRKAQPLKAVANVVAKIAPVAALVAPIVPVAIAAKVASIVKGKSIFKRIAPLVAAGTKVADVARPLVNAATSLAPTSAPLPEATRKGIAARIQQRVVEMRAKAVADAQAAQAAQAIQAAATPPVTTLPAQPPPPAPEPVTTYASSSALAPSSTVPVSFSADPASVMAPAAVTDAGKTTGSGAGAMPLVIAGAVVVGLYAMSQGRKGRR